MRRGHRRIGCWRGCEMDLRTVMVPTVFFGAIACLTAIASSPIGNPDKEAATAAAVRYDLREYLDFLGDHLGEDHLANGDEKLPELIICLASDVPLDIDSVAQNLTDAKIKPVPVTACSSETIKGDFGMFTAITNYFGPDGEEAGHLVIVRASCATTKSCVIDIDGRGSGARYWVERSGHTWTVVDGRLRWIV